MIHLKNNISMQKTAIRLISDVNYNAHSEPLFKANNILPFRDLIIFFNLQIMQRYIQGFLPISFRNVWLTNEARNQRDDLNIVLRNSANLQIPFARLTMTRRQPLVQLPKVWCEFRNEDIKIIRNKLEFNMKLKKYLLSELSEIPVCNRLFCPACTRIFQ
jgi:hypothetical protein